MFQKKFWPFTVWINCSSDLKRFENFQPSVSKQKVKPILETKYHCLTPHSCPFFGFMTTDISSLYFVKGQLISKYPFGVFVLTTFLTISVLASYKKEVESKNRQRHFMFFWLFENYLGNLDFWSKRRHQKDIPKLTDL